MNTITCRSLGGALSCLLVVGCASISNGRYEQIDVVSDTPGMAVRIECNDGWISEGVTPASLVVPRKAEGCSVCAEVNGVWELDSALAVGCDEYLVDRLFYAIDPQSDSSICSGSGEAAGICVVLYLATLPFTYAGAKIADLIDDHTGGPCYHEPNPIRIELHTPASPSGNDAGLKNADTGYGPGPATRGSPALPIPEL